MQGRSGQHGHTCLQVAFNARHWVRVNQRSSFSFALNPSQMYTYDIFITLMWLGHRSVAPCLSPLPKATDRRMCEQALPAPAKQQA
jgi:hypothetical protein